MGLFNSAIVVVAFAAAKELFSLEIAGTSVGLVNLFPFLGGAVAPPVLGAILEIHQQAAGGYSAAAYSRAFMLHVAFALIAFVAAFFVEETIDRAPGSTVAQPSQIRMGLKDHGNMKI